MHTPTPWRAYKTDVLGADGNLIADASDDALIRKFEARANAALIAKAVNSHAELVSACKLALDFAEFELEQRQGSGIPDYIAEAQEVVTACRSALALAAPAREGEQ